MITKTAIGNYLRKQPNGDVGMYRNGFKDGVQWAQKRLAQPAEPLTDKEQIAKNRRELLQQMNAQPAFDEAALIAKGWRLQDCKICGESASAYVSSKQPARPINCGTGYCSCIECLYEDKP